MSLPDLIPLTDNKNPKVSVCIASYNHARYIRETLDSILAQTFRDFEVIIVDDGSKDDSLNILNEYAEAHSQIKVFTHPDNENKGNSITINTAISNSRGEYISFIGSDDIWYPNFLEKQVELLDTSLVGFVYSQADCINGKGIFLGARIGIDCSQETDQLLTLLTTNPIPAMTVTIRRDCLDKLGLYSEKVIYNDWELWIRLLNFYKVGFINEPLAKYRIHDKNTSVGINPSKHYSHIRQMYLHLQKSLHSPEYAKLEEPKYQKIIVEQLTTLSEREARDQFNMYFALVAQKDFAKALTALKRAFRCSPKLAFHPRRLLAVGKHAFLNLVS